MVLEFLNPIFDPLFDPLLHLPSFWIIAIITFFFTLLSSIIYKYTTDQDLMKRLKLEQKDLRKKMKDHRDDPGKMKEYQGEFSRKSLEQMKHSMKPMLFTTLPVLILFGWLGSHLAYASLMPNEPFSVDVVLREPANVSLSTDLEQVAVRAENLNYTWHLKGPSGKYILEFTVGEQQYEHTLIVTDEQRYVQPLKTFPSGVIESIHINNPELKPFSTISFFGWQPGWLGIYIIISIILNLGIRKVLNIH